MTIKITGNYWTLKENSEQVFALIGPTPSWREVQQRSMQMDLQVKPPSDTSNYQPQRQQVVKNEVQQQGHKRAAETDHSIDHILNKQPKLSSVANGQPSSGGSCSSTPESQSSSRTNEFAANQLLRARIHHNLMMSSYWQQVCLQSLPMLDPRFYSAAPPVAQPGFLNSALQPNLFNFAPQPPLPPFSFANFAAQQSAQNNHDA